MVLGAYLFLNYNFDLRLRSSLFQKGKAIEKMKTKPILQFNAEKAPLKKAFFPRIWIAEKKINNEYEKEGSSFLTIKPSTITNWQKR